jgi:hypothetical protein
MKKAIILLCVCKISFGQSFTFTHFKQNFQYLNNSTVLTPPSWNPSWQSVITLGFNFSFLGVNTNSVLVNAGSLVYFDGKGDYSFSACGTAYQSRGNSPILYKVEGSNGSKILKVEYRNVGFTNSDYTEDSITFQIWLYQTSNILEVHYGPSSLIQPTSAFNRDEGPVVEILGGSTQATEYILFLTGNADNPTTSSNYNNVKDYITGVPKEGTVYRFTPTLSNINDNILQEFSITFDNEKRELRILNSNFSNSLHSVSILNNLGQIIIKQKISDKLSIEGLPQGLYFVSVESEQGAYTKKFWKGQ